MQNQFDKVTNSVTYSDTYTYGQANTKAIATNERKSMGSWFNREQSFLRSVINAEDTVGTASSIYNADNYSNNRIEDVSGNINLRVKDSQSTESFIYRNNLYPEGLPKSNSEPNSTGKYNTITDSIPSYAQHTPGGFPGAREGYAQHAHGGFPGTREGYAQHAHGGFPGTREGYAQHAHGGFPGTREGYAQHAHGGFPGTREGYAQHAHGGFPGTREGYAQHAHGGFPGQTDNMNKRFYTSETRDESFDERWHESWNIAQRRNNILRAKEELKKQQDRLIQMKAEFKQYIEQIRYNH